MKHAGKRRGIKMCAVCKKSVFEYDDSVVQTPNGLAHMRCWNARGKRLRPKKNSV